MKEFKTCCDYQENHKILWVWDKNTENYEPELIQCEVCKRIVKEI